MQKHEASFQSNAELAQLIQIAITHHQAGRLNQAEAIYSQILRSNPKHADALHLTGMIAYRKGELNLAFESISNAIEVKPTAACYHCNLGIILQAQQKLDKAAMSYRKALSIDPNDATAHYNLAVSLNLQGRLDEAIQHCQKALAIKPNLAAAYNTLGMAFKGQAKLKEALDCCQKAFQLTPNDADVCLNLSVVYKECGDLNAAHEYLHKALSIKPDFPEAYNALGHLLMALGDQAEALNVYQKGLKLNPRFAPLHHSLIFAASRILIDDEAKVFELSRNFGGQFETGLHRLPHSNDATPTRRIRVGYVSADFCKHSVAYFIEPILAHHNRQNIESFCYYNHHQIDSVTLRLMDLADHWRSILGLSDSDAEALIRQDAIDILIDLSGHTAGNRLVLFARKPAPIQASWIGYPSTTGLTAIDYRLTHLAVDPPGSNDAFHTEKLIRLSSPACFEPEADLPEIGSLPALKNTHITFASFHDPNKITPMTLSLWAKVLHALPDSRLLICPNASQAKIIAQLEALGIAPDRLHFLGRQSVADYLSLHNRVDILLDTYPYNGGTVSRHALWMGVPVLTLAGKSAVSRCGLALMKQLGLDSFVAECEADFVNHACRWANDIDGLSEVRESLREKVRNAPFSQAHLVVDELEAAYRSMWLHWCEQKL